MIERFAKAVGCLSTGLVMAAHLGIAEARGDVEKRGDILQILIPAAGLTAALVLEEDNAGAVQFLQSLALSQTTTEVLKAITHKRRPDGNCCRSFPSGHTSAAFMGASFIHFRYGFRYSIAAYLGATYVAYSRVQAEKHFVEDVVAGAAVGILSSYYFTSPLENGTFSAAFDGDRFEIEYRRDW